MKNYPEQIYIPEEEPDYSGELEPRMCDYCDTMLIDEFGTAIQTAYLTDFGLFCSDCIDSAETKDTYYEGDSVIDERWYRMGT